MNKISFRLKHTLTLGFIFLAIGACSSTSPQSPSFDKNFNQIYAEMPQSQVEQLLGAPLLKELQDGTETWHYSQSGGRRVHFREKKVIGYGAEPPKLVSVPAATPQGSPASVVVDRALGEACDVDGECQSGNCHFHKCSGKNNCHVREGGVCAKDSQCCTGFCDFQICRKRK